MIQKIMICFGFTAIFLAQANAPQAFDPFVGKWIGTLEYKDYQGSGRVKIPVKLEVKSSNATTAIWDFVYDDFGKPVPSFETHIWNGTTYRVQTKGQTVIQEYTSPDFAVLIKKGFGKAVLLGNEIEIGAKIEVGAPPSARSSPPSCRASPTCLCRSGRGHAARRPGRHRRSSPHRRGSKACPACRSCGSSGPLPSRYGSRRPCGPGSPC